MTISIRTHFFEVLHSKFFGQWKIVHFFQTIVHYVTGNSRFSRQIKEGRERSNGQTPFTMITKITKTASPKIVNKRF